MRLAFVLFSIFMVVLAVFLFADVDGLARLAVEQQRAFQNQMAAAVRALQSGDPGAFVALLSAAGAYGFIHAVGPGHGKYLIGGVGLGTSVSAPRLLAVAITSSLAQALWAIGLVYGGFFLLDLSARRMTAVTENMLAPASYVAIGCIGLALVVRGARSLLRHSNLGRSSGDQHSHGSCGCNAHGPSPEDVAKLATLRETAALVTSIALRPCTGAVFLLVIAWQMDIRLAGAAAVLMMGFGTASLTSLVACSSLVARGAAFASIGSFDVSRPIGPTVQLLAGGCIIWFSVVLFGTSV